MKKAQITVEYIVVGIAILLLTGFAIIFVTSGPDAQWTQRYTENAFWSSADIGIHIHQHTGSQFRIGVINNLNEDIIIKNITVSNSLGSQTFVVTTHTLAPQQAKQYNLSHSHNTIQLGRTYAYDITFGYTRPTYNTDHTFIGQTPLRGRLS